MPGNEERGSRSGAWWVFLFFLALYLLTRGEGFYSTDGETMAWTTWSIVDRGRLDIPCAESLPAALRGPDGKCYSRYGLGQPLAAIPFYLTGKLAKALLPAADYGALIRFTLSRLNQFITALACALLFSLARKLYRSPEMGIGLALAYGLGTMAWPYARFYFSEPLTALCLLLAVYALFHLKENPVAFWSTLAGFAFGYAALTRLSALVVLPFLLGYLWYIIPARHRSLVRWIQLVAAFLAPVAFFLTIQALYGYRAFGSPFLSGYAGESWSTPLPLGLYGLLFSPGKGLLLFVPLTLLVPLALVRFYKAGHKGEALLFTGIFAAYLLLHAGWWTWHGGWSWGPRFLVPTLPFLVLPLGALWRRGKWERQALIVLGALSIPVQLLGVLVNFNDYMLWINDENKILFSPGYSPLLGHLRFMINGGPLDLASSDLSAFGLSTVGDHLFPLACVLVLAVAGFMLWREACQQKMSQR